MKAESTDFQSRLLRWYDAHRRDLPWRAVDPATGRPSAYAVLLSEFMLQQTQVATVIPYFHRFLAAFPTIADLAAAEEERVLRLWQGLGYYSRARNLLRAARAVVAEHGGRVPDAVEALLALPGIGRYTAGAIASIAHDTRAPIVDGNVVRVLCRLDAITDDPRERATVARLWARAEELVPADRPGDFNSAMMELGATVCTPRNPQCLICPVAAACEAHDRGIEEQIPVPKPTKRTPLESRRIYCLSRAVAGRVEYAFEQRPPTGRWAGMWQFVTRRPGADEIAAVVANVEPLGTIAHALTHRRYTFEVVRGTADVPAARWLTLDASDALPLPKPHVRVREILRP